MNRWKAGALPGVLACVAALSLTAVAALPRPALAQGVAPDAVRDLQFARLRVVQSPDILLNDQPARLSPGARIRNAANLITLPASLAGQELPVLFRRESNGLVHEAWILSEAEAAALRRATTPTALSDAIALLLAARR